MESFFAIFSFYFSAKFPATSNKQESVLFQLTNDCCKEK